MSSARNYESLGREVKQQLGDGPGPERREHIKKAFREMTVASRHRPPQRRIRLARAAAFVLLTGVATFVLMELMVPRPLVFWVGSETIQGEEGAWLQASADAPLPVRFEDGTRVELRESSTGRVVTANRKKVDIELGGGKLKTSINRQKTRSSWTVHAGPYRVTALGTEFSVVWKAEPRSLDVSVFRGRVRVKGPGLQPKGEELGKGEHLSLREEGKKTVTRFGKDAPEEQVVGSGPGVLDKLEKDEAIRIAKLTLPANDIGMPAEPAREKATARPDKKVAGLDGHLPESWQELYDLRRYSEALEVASKLGIEELSETLNDRELWQLADAARYAGRGVEAKQALLSLRKRFRGSWRATIAAFLLGRVAFESQGDARAACNWFQIYLHEDPAGRLAEEALGRSIGACDEAGMRARALKAAQEYKQKYPQGSFSEAADLMSSMGKDVPR